MNTDNYTSKAFKHAIFGLILILTLVLFSIFFIPSKFGFVSVLYEIILFVIGINAIIGLIVSIKGLKEPNSNKKTVGTIINFGIFGLLLVIVVLNLVEVFKNLI